MPQRRRDYTSIVWALLLGYALVVASGLYILYRETVRGIERPRIKPTSLG